MAKREDKIDTLFKASLPKMSESELEVIKNLPTEFQIECPYIIQEKMHWSGAACAQMLHEFHRRPAPSQADAAYALRLDDWRFTNHETLEDDFVVYMAKRNFIPGIYFPAMYARRNFKDARQMGDFIYSNAQEIHDIDLQFFKAVLVTTKQPVFMRIHFTCDEYNMPEEMARRLDNVGHAVLMVGYNSEGLILHDPWDKAWGGSGGGAGVFMDNHTAGIPGKHVNSTLDFIASFSRLEVSLRFPDAVPYPNRELRISARIRNPGMNGVLSDHFILNDLSGVLQVDRGLTVAEPRSQGGKSLLPGEETYLSWVIRTGTEVGSFPLRVLVGVAVDLPVRPWERNRSVHERVHVSEVSSLRIDVKDPNWFPLYGQLST